jgi:hypothetical protein
MEVKEVGESVQKNLMSFLLQKPIWIFWIVYSVLSGILFGIFYTTIYLVAQRWWIPVVVIIVIGMIWGTVAYTSGTHDVKGKKDPQLEI